MLHASTIFDGGMYFNKYIHIFIYSRVVNTMRSAGVQSSNEIRNLQTIFLRARIYCMIDLVQYKKQMRPSTARISVLLLPNESKWAGKVSDFQRKLKFNCLLLQYSHRLVYVIKTFSNIYSQIQTRQRRLHN